MPRICDMCLNTRADLDVELLLGDRSFEEVGQMFGLSRAAVDRHLDHLTTIVPREFRRAAQARTSRGLKPLLDKVTGKRLNESAEAEPPTQGQVYARLYELEEVALRVMNQAEERHDLKLSIDAIRTAELLIKRCAELAGMLGGKDSNTVIMLTHSPDFLKLQATIVEALADNPAGALAVAEALGLPAPGVYTEAEVVE